VNHEDVIARSGSIRRLASALRDLDILQDERHCSGEHLKAVDILKEHFCASDPRRPESCYTRTYRAFTWRYLLPNVLKNYKLLCELDDLGLLRSCRHLLDLGSGPGTFALSLLCWLQDSLNAGGQGNRRPDRAQEAQFIIHMVDAVEPFLDIFRRVWEHLDLPAKSRLRILPSNARLVGSVGEFCDAPQLIVLSNCLVEMMRDAGVVQDSFTRSLRDSQAIIAVIDYPYGSCRPYVRSFIEQVRPAYRWLETSGLESWVDGFELIDLAPTGTDESMAPDLHTFIDGRQIHYLRAVLVPARGEDFLRKKDAWRLLTEYGTAWETHDLDLITELFTDDATYTEKEGQPPLRGLSAICDYWRINAQQQRHVSFHVQSLAVAGNSITAHWSCSFYRRDLELWMHLTGQLRVRVRNGRIYEFSESFERTLSRSRSAPSQLRRSAGDRGPASRGQGDRVRPTARDHRSAGSVQTLRPGIP